MLIDIFARRYKDHILRSSFEQQDSRLLTQAFRILRDDLCPYYEDGKESESGVKFWTKLHDDLSRELGLYELSPKYFSYVTKWNGKDHVNTTKNTALAVCEKWMNHTVSGSPDVHIKERLSLIELGFRMREQAVASMNAAPISPLETFYISLTNQSSSASSNYDATVRQRRIARDTQFRLAVEELNTRFCHADYTLNYHNGFIQMSTDKLIQEEVETPFWSLVSGAQWKNVDTDIKEALDLRDSNGRDPAFYAARALESTIKIISDQKGWTHGKEKGAHNYIDNLASRANVFIEAWESCCLKKFFTDVRNPVVHGAGSADMPTLSRPQAEWAIEFSMIWIKTLIRRL